MGVKKHFKRKREEEGKEERERRRERGEAEANAPAATTTSGKASEASGAEAEAPPESMVGAFQLRRATTDKRMSNRQKCLVLGGRNLSSKDRHLMVDLRNLMPHAREHAKLGRTNTLGDDIIELCELHQCNSVMFLEPHRSDVSYLWIAQAPSGPSVKMQLLNVHTADEIRMAGNCLKFSRPLLHFDREFETQPHLRVAKSLLHMAFNTPRYHPKSKPFVDRIMSFYWLDDHIWVRNYQIVDTKPTSLMEIGPRFTLEPVAILNGCCKGNVLWKSSTAKAPTEQRRDRNSRRLEKREANEAIKAKAENHRARYPTRAVDPLDLVFQN